MGLTAGDRFDYPPLCWRRRPIRDGWRRRPSPGPLTNRPPRALDTGGQQGRREQREASARQRRSRRRRYSVGLGLLIRADALTAARPHLFGRPPKPPFNAVVIVAPTTVSASATPTAATTPAGHTTTRVAGEHAGEAVTFGRVDRQAVLRLTATTRDANQPRFWGGPQSPASRSLCAGRPWRV